MMLLLALEPVSLLQVPRSCSVHVVHDLVKHTTIPSAELELDSRVRIFGTSDELDVLQDDRLKNDHPLGVTLPILYAVDLH